MGNRALILPEHQAKIGHAHFGNAKGRQDADAGRVGEDRKKIGEIGGDLVFRQIIADDVLVVRGKDQWFSLVKGVHNFILIGIYHIVNAKKRRNHSHNGRFWQKGRILCKTVGCF